MPSVHLFVSTSRDSHQSKISFSVCTHNIYLYNFLGGMASQIESSHGYYLELSSLTLIFEKINWLNLHYCKYYLDYNYVWLSLVCMHACMYMYADLYTSKQSRNNTVQFWHNLQMSVSINSLIKEKEIFIYLRVCV